MSAHPSVGLPAFEAVAAAAQYPLSLPAEMITSAAADPSPHSMWRPQWRRMLRTTFVFSVLSLLLAVQVLGALHLKGSPGLELLIAALTPGLFLLFVYVGLFAS